MFGLLIGEQKTKIGAQGIECCKCTISRIAIKIDRLRSGIGSINISSRPRIARSVFAAPFAKEWGRLAGLWHDAGKYQKAFQDYLAASGDHTATKVDHSSVGALIAWEKRAAPLAFVVAGHHGGLSNKQDLRVRLEKKRNLLDAAREFGLPASLEKLSTPADPIGFSETARALRDTEYCSPREDFSPIAFLSAVQEAQPDPFLQIVIRSGMAAGEITSAVRRAIAQVNPLIDVEFHWFETSVQEGLLRERLMATLSGSFGAGQGSIVALVLRQAGMLLAIGIQQGPF